MSINEQELLCGLTACMHQRCENLNGVREEGWDEGAPQGWQCGNDTVWNNSEMS
jgi:hypothetical protein